MSSTPTISIARQGSISHPGRRRNSRIAGFAAYLRHNSWLRAPAVGENGAGTCFAARAISINDDLAVQCMRLPAVGEGMIRVGRHSPGADPMAVVTVSLSARAWHSLALAEVLNGMMSAVERSAAVRANVALTANGLQACRMLAASETVDAIEAVMRAVEQALARADKVRDSVCLYDLHAIDTCSQGGNVFRRSVPRGASQQIGMGDA